jgi:hypothetical protein
MKAEYTKRVGSFFMTIKSDPTIDDEPSENETLVEFDPNTMTAWQHTILAMLAKGEVLKAFADNEIATDERLGVTYLSSSTIPGEIVINVSWT